MSRGASKTVVSLLQQLDVLDVRRNFGGGQRRLRVGFGEAVEAEDVWVNLAPEMSLAGYTPHFPAIL